MTLITCPKTVPEAARILDKKIKGWYKKINVKILDLGHCSNCILGQLFGDAGSQNIFDENEGFDREFGGESFLSTSPFGYRNRLDKELQWTAEINIRLKRNERRRELAAKKKLPAPLSPLPDQIIVYLTNDVYRVAKDYTDVINCPIATAVKQQFPGHGQNISVGPYSIKFYEHDAKGNYVKTNTYNIVGDMGSCTFVEFAAENKLQVAVIANKA